MSQQYYDDDRDETQGQHQPERTNQEWAEFRQEKKARREAEERGKTAERELAFYKAGLDPAKDPRLGYFMRGYDGKVDAESIRQAAISAGFISGENPATPEQSADLAAGARIDAAGAGATPPSVGPDAAKQALAEAMKTGDSDAVAALMRSQGIPVVEQY